MRILLFGNGSKLSLSCLEALRSAGHELVLVTRRSGSVSKLRPRFLQRAPASERFARRATIPIVRYANPETSAGQIAAHAPDIICIAAFSLLIPREIAELAPLGAINLHPSLLPRHRGPQTLFQIYQDGDTETGITVHRATSAFDAGPIILQEKLAIPRGYPVERIASELVLRAGPMLARAVRLVAAGAPEVPQDEARASRAVRFHSSFRAPLDEWDVEQSWHFLAGYCALWKQQLCDPDGKPITYRSVSGYARVPHALPPGTVEAQGDGWVLYCKGGVIRLEA